jgi:hypothetical protein
VRERILILIIILAVSPFVPPPAVHAQRAMPDPVAELLKEVSETMPADRSGTYLVPSDEDLQNWGRILELFRRKAIDSCKLAMARYNYSLTQLKDNMTGAVYDVFRENTPITRGWGTFIYNRNSSKRLFVHVNHPVDDAHALMLGAELFRRLNGEWLLIGGTSRRAVPGKLLADMGLVKRSIFQRWHETLTDLTHVTLSVHSYAEANYPYPISVTDVIVSNGRTSDEQWGISQLSLAVRDTLRAAGFACGLAMYDSGYSRLAAGWNPQGTFSNDSVGFGHWLNLELSKNVRANPAMTAKLIAATNRALELTGKRIAQHVNRGFGLVSPRVIRLDSLHGLFFPPSGEDSYRIISFNPGKTKGDTVNLRMGNWIEFMGAKKGVTQVKVFDTAAPGAGEPAPVTARIREGVGSRYARIVEKSPEEARAVMKLGRREASDTSAAGAEDDGRSFEPLQVHRIPLRPVLTETYSTQRPEEKQGAPYRWEGFVPSRFRPAIPVFQVGDEEPADRGTVQQFLIPIIRSSYPEGANRFIGVQMTSLLVDEIARLLSDSHVQEKRIGLMAEQTDEGEYYLRLFPGSYRDITALTPSKK